MTKLIEAVLLCMLPSLGTMAASASPNVRVSAMHVEWVRCGKPSGMKMVLRVELRNEAQDSLVLGRIEVAQERVYRKGAKGNPELIGTTNVPDEFVDPNSPDDFADIQEQNLPRHASKTFTTVHYVYLADLPSPDGTSRKLIVSFHITNVRRDGSASEYWSDPITITLPRDCTVE
jgi:hypothetical protein